MAAVAFESVVKLVPSGGRHFCHLRHFDGFGDLFQRAVAVPDLARLLRMIRAAGTWICADPAVRLAIIFLPASSRSSWWKTSMNPCQTGGLAVSALSAADQHFRMLPLALGGLLHFGGGASIPIPSC